MVKGGLVVAAIVEDVAEVDPGLGVVFVDFEGSAQGRDCRFVVAKPVLSVADARHGFGRIGRLTRGDLEVFARLFDQAFAEKCAADLEHQLDVVFVAELEGVAEASECGGLLSEFEQGLAKSGECVFVFGVEDERFLEASACPRIFFARVVRITDANVQLYRIGIERESLSKYVQSLVVLAFIVQLMRSLIILLGTQKRG